MWDNLSLEKSLSRTISLGQFIVANCQFVRRIVVSATGGFFYELRKTIGNEWGLGSDHKGVNELFLPMSFPRCNTRKGRGSGRRLWWKTKQNIPGVEHGITSSFENLKCEYFRYLKVTSHEGWNKFVYTKAQSRVIGQEQLCPKMMKKVKWVRTDRPT